MNGHVFSLLCASLLAALSVRPAAAQTLLQRCDKPAAEAEVAVQQVAACSAALVQANAALKAGAGKGAVAAGEIVRFEVSTATLSPDLAKAATVEPLAGKLFAYYVYSAYMAGDASLCDPLLHIKDGPRCRMFMPQLVLSRAMMGTDAEFAAACRQSDEKESMKTAQCCEKMAAGRGQPNPCAKIVPLCAIDQGSCRAFFSSLAGDVGGCRKIPLEKKQSGVSDALTDCRETAVFTKAYKAKNVALCGASDRCRVLMGAGKQVVQELNAELLKTPVGRWFVRREWAKTTRQKIGGKFAPPPPPLPAPKTDPKPVAAQIATTLKGFVCEEPIGSVANRKLVTAALNAASTCLADIELAMARTDLATVRGIDAQQEKIARLSVRLNALLEGSGARKPPEKRPK